MNKILITGGNGQLGLALKDVLAKEEILLTDTDNMDITEPSQIERIFADFKPTHLIHGAAMTNVDGCEENPELAQKVNADGTKKLAEACKKHKCRMIYVSTDYVFDGKKQESYTEKDKTNPQSVYGKTKLDGEKHTLELPNSYVVRTSWVYGEGKNFVRTMLALSEKMEEVRVVNDQFGRPTYAPDLARAIYDIIQKNPMTGIYNVTGDGSVISWADFAREIFKIASKKTKVVGISTEEYLSQYPDKKIALRPEYSSLDLEKIKKITSLENWPSSLDKYVSKEK
ncbi:MAG: dTDP-4-dehydrorhamnose reductase [Patescibacteria group bacterium]